MHSAHIYFLLIQLRLRLFCTYFFFFYYTTEKTPGHASTLLSLIHTIVVGGRAVSVPVWVRVWVRVRVRVWVRAWVWVGVGEGPYFLCYFFRV